MKKNYDFFSQKNMIIFFVVILLMVVIYSYSTQFTKKITIKNLTYFRSSSKNSHNLISDENNNIYEISNSIWYMFFTSAELYSSLKDNETYIIKGYGLRIPLLGFYPIIIKATPINS